MSPELVGTAAAWLCHTLWYLADPLRAQRLGWTRPLTPSRLVALRLTAMGLAGLSVAFWAQAHGLVLGVCCALAALTAAASVNTLAGPLSRRAVLASSAVAAFVVCVRCVEVLSGS